MIEPGVADDGTALDLGSATRRARRSLAMIEPGVADDGTALEPDRRRRLSKGPAPDRRRAPHLQLETPNAICSFMLVCDATRQCTCTFLCQ